MVNRRYWLYLSGGLGLAGCGFKLRGTVQFGFKNLYVNFSQSSPIGGEFRRAIRTAGDVTLVETPSQADLVMNVMGEAREKEITGFSSTGRPREYQLRLRFIYALRDSQQRPVGTDSNLILLRRDITTTDAQLAAKQQEEVLLYREMQTDLIQQLIRRLAAVNVPPKQG
jgi:LPS-assembly lipoprotein